MNLREIAAHRTALHSGQASQQILAHDHDFIGLVGEDQFAKEFGLEVDFQERIAGDRGRDFIIETFDGRFKVDVKAARNPRKSGLLVREEHLKFYTIYVLAQFHRETETATLLGWEWGLTLWRIGGPPRDTGYGFINYKLELSWLRPVEELKENCV